MTNKLEDRLNNDFFIFSCRDRLSSSCGVLKHCLRELVKYIKSCEEEVNNTLISEVMRLQEQDMSNSCIDESYINKEAITMMDSMSGESLRHSGSECGPSDKVKRVRFTPQLVEIAQIVNSGDDFWDATNLSQDCVKKLKSHLKTSLARFKNDSAYILKIGVMSETEEEANDDQDSFILDRDSLISRLQKDNEQLKVMLSKSQEQSFGIESSKEIVSEGYGEQSCDEDTSQELSHLLDRGENFDFKEVNVQIV